ncbi:MAG: MFS transporter [Bdellovibrio sp.]
MGLIGAAFGLGFIVGPALGGVLSLLGGPSLAGKVVAGLCLLTALFGLLFLQETHTNLGKARPRQSPWQSFVKSWDTPGLRNVFLAQGGASIAMTLMESCLILWMVDRLQWKLPDINWGFVSIGILSAFFQGFLVRKLLPIWGERRTLLVGLLLFSLGLGLIPFWEQAWWVGLCMLFFVFGNSLTNPSLLGSVSLLSGAEDQGAHLGVSQSMSSLGRIVGPALGGALYLKYPPGAFFVAGLMGGFVWLGLFTQRRLLPDAAALRSNSPNLASSTEVPSR